MATLTGKAERSREARRAGARMALGRGDERGTPTRKAPFPGNQSKITTLIRDVVGRL